MKAEEFVSEHFDLHQVAEGAYAGIAKEGGAAFSNAAIIDLGGKVIILDTFETQKAAEDLKQAAEQVVGNPASLVVISHSHDDHWMGNQVFGDQVDILATHPTREAMMRSGQDLLEMKNDPSELEEMIQERQGEAEAEADELKRSAINASIARLREHFETLSTFEPRYPNLTFESNLHLHGAIRSIEIVTKGAGHTSSDCYLVLPEDKVMFMADLGFFAAQPFTAYADPQAWVAQLAGMEGMDIEVFVPGHGPVGGKEDVAIQKAYISLVEQLVGEVVADGGSEEDALLIALPEPYASWKQTGQARFEANVRGTFARLTGE